MLKPLYSQVRDMLATRISAGEWPPGAMLPNETNLAGEFGVSIGTIRRAVEGLEDMGLVIRKQGRGTYVGGLGASGAANRLCRLRAPSGQQLKIARHLDGFHRRVATASEIARLQLPGHVEVCEYRTILVSRSARIGVEVSVVPGLIASGLRDDPPGDTDLYAQLATSGYLVTTAEESVSAGQADERVALQLRVAPGAPMLVVQRVARGIDQRPVELRCGQYLGSHITYMNRIV